MRSVSICAAVVLFVVGFPAFANGPHGGPCPITDSALQHASYQIVVVGSNLSTKSTEIGRAFHSVKSNHNIHIGNVSFSVHPIDQITPEVSESLDSGSVYVLCEDGACGGNKHDDQMIIVEYGELIADAVGFSVAGGHIARATVSRIQYVESGRGIDGPAFLSLSHMLTQ